MNKTILGLDLGVASIGWALVNENQQNNKENKIIKLGVRVSYLDNFVNAKTGTEVKNPILDFNSGRPISPNAGRTLKRTARRNLQRFKLRREVLVKILKEHHILKNGDLLAEVGKNSTFQTQELRAKSAKQRIELNELARVLLLINKKRGYKSSRKAKNDDEGQIIDGMSVAKQLYEENKTPGEFTYQILKNGKKQIPDFYRSDLQNELEKVWSFQKQFYPEILTENLKKELVGKGLRATWAILKEPFSLVGIKQTGTLQERKTEKYLWRSEAIKKQLDLEKLAVVFQEINGNLNNSSGYLGAISDRSKELYFNNQTVGEFLFAQLQENPHSRLKNQVFYRQDYLDEFEKIWETQAKFHQELTPELKTEIRDIVIFYQRKLKSQKGLISFCEFENREIVTKDGKKKTVGLKVAPKSSPLFQEFKIWQVLNNIELKNAEGKRLLDLEEKQRIFDEVNIKGNITGQKALELLGFKGKDVKINFRNIEGNRTNQSLYDAYLKILEIEGYNVFELLKVKSDKDEAKLSELEVDAEEITEMVKSIFEANEIDADILNFNAELEGKEFENQKSYQLWHLLYSYEGDNSASGNEKLYQLLAEKFGFKKEHSQILAGIFFAQEYGGLSSKAMRKIYPFIKENKYSDACNLAGYNHSKNSLTKEDLANRVPNDFLEILPKNALRNPVVEKILNQMINLVNEIIKEYGRPDEIRIELARELKKNAKEREEMTKSINESTLLHQKYADTLKKEFGIPVPSRNDIIRYKLYLELATNGFKDLYTDKKIEKENLFTDKYDIDHIIPQSKFFDDSFSNKVLVPRQANLDKGNDTAIDYIEKFFGQKGVERFLNKIDLVLKSKEGISGKTQAEISSMNSKFLKLQKKGSEIGDGFIERDKRDTQYIAKKAKEILFEISNSVVSTTGKITSRLREDWNLVNTMKELNLEKFRKLGLTEMIKNSKGEDKEIINDWSKRNDHRHHAMDALTVAFTTHSHVQYLNYLNARNDEKHKEHKNIFAIENIITEVIEKKNGKKQRKFKSPIEKFRVEAKKHLEEVLISHKTKNKVVTKNINKIKKKGAEFKKIELTPRGQLHKETIYGSAQFLKTKEEKINAKFDLETINKVENPIYRNVILKRFAENGNDAKKAFSGKNAVNKNPIYLDDDKTQKLPETVKLSWYETGYTIRKQVNADNFKDYKNLEKITDEGVKRILIDRLNQFKGNAKEAFSDLEKNPIWLNEEKGIAIKTVTITGVSNVESLHFKKDHLGNEILDKNGQKIPVDFVSTGNNHHVAIYKDAEGNLQEKVVSFYEAVERVNQGLPIVDKDFNKDLGWEFQFTMKQNEMFLFPSEDFNPKEIDLLDEKNLNLISKNLFRVQKLANRDYTFRHHLETKVDGNKELTDIAFKRIQSVNNLKELVKVRLDHLGKIVQIGEY